VWPDFPGDSVHPTTDQKETDKQNDWLRVVVLNTERAEQIADGQGKAS